MQSKNQRFIHSKLTSRPAEKSYRFRVPDVDFKGQFKDVSDEVLKKEKSTLSRGTASKLLALAIARTNRR